MAKSDNRTTYTTSLNKDLIEKFRIYCKIKKTQQNVVIEDLIQNKIDEDQELKVMIEKLLEMGGGDNGNTNN